MYMEGLNIIKDSSAKLDETLIRAPLAGSLSSDWHAFEGVLLG